MLKRTELLELWKGVEAGKFTLAELSPDRARAVKDYRAARHAKHLERLEQFKRNTRRKGARDAGK